MLFLNLKVLVFFKKNEFFLKKFKKIDVPFFLTKASFFVQNLKNRSFLLKKVKKKNKYSNLVKAFFASFLLKFLISSMSTPTGELQMAKAIVFFVWLKLKKTFKFLILGLLNLL